MALRAVWAPRASGLSTGIAPGTTACSRFGLTTSGHHSGGAERLWARRPAGFVLLWSGLLRDEEAIGLGEFRACGFNGWKQQEDSSARVSYIPGGLFV